MGGKRDPCRVSASISSARWSTLDTDAPVGVLRPMPVEGSGFAVEADSVIMAIGQDPDLTAFAAVPAAGGGPPAARIWPPARPASRCVRGRRRGQPVHRYVSAAIGAGRRAAWGHRRLLGHPYRRPVLPQLDLAQAVQKRGDQYLLLPARERTEKQRTGAAERLLGFAEVALAFSADQAAHGVGAVHELRPCVECDNCFVFCPDIAMEPRRRGYVVLTNTARAADSACRVPPGRCPPRAGDAIGREERARAGDA